MPHHFVRIDSWHNKVLIKNTHNAFEIQSYLSKGSSRRFACYSIDFSILVEESKAHSDLTLYIHLLVRSNFFVVVTILWVCFCVFMVLHPTPEFFTHIETSTLMVKAARFDLCSALMAIEQWGFFRMPNQLWHGASIYNGHFRGPATLTSVAERLIVELSLPTFTPWVCRSWNSNTKPSACEANALIDCSTAAVFTTSLY